MKWIDVADGWSGVSGDDTTDRKPVRQIWQESLHHSASHSLSHSVWFVYLTQLFFHHLPIF